MPRYKHTNPTMKKYMEDNYIKQSVVLGDGKRYRLPDNWFFDGNPTPDNDQFHNIKIVRLMENDDPEKPPQIAAHWEGYGYQVFNARPRSFSNFKIKRDFKRDDRWRDFDPAVKHLICQAKAHDSYKGSLYKEDTQELLDACRLHKDLPEVEFTTDRVVK